MGEQKGGGAKGVGDCYGWSQCGYNNDKVDSSSAVDGREADEIGRALQVRIDEGCRQHKAEAEMKVVEGSSRFPEGQVKTIVIQGR